MRKTSLILFLLFFIVGCGYKPSSYYAKNELNSNIYVNTKIDIKNSEGSVLAKEIINNMVLDNLNANIVNRRDMADYILDVFIKGVDTISLQTDNEGYVSVKRVTVTIDVVYRKNITHSQKRTIEVSSYDDYIVSDDSIVTERNKRYAITNAVSKALDNIFLKISINSFKK